MQNSKMGELHFGILHFDLGITIGGNASSSVGTDCGGKRSGSHTCDQDNSDYPDLASKYNPADCGNSTGHRDND